MSLVQATIEVNRKQRQSIVNKLQSNLKVLPEKRSEYLGLAFKPNTDDLRDAPALDVIRQLLELGANVKVYDPVAMDNCKKHYPDLHVEYATAVEELFDGCHAVVLVTEWDEFRHQQYEELGKRMKEKLLIDGRNVLNGTVLKQAGFRYSGIGKE